MPRYVGFRRYSFCFVYVKNNPGVAYADVYIQDTELGGELITKLMAIPSKDYHGFAVLAFSSTGNAILVNPSGGSVKLGFVADGHFIS